MIYIIIIWWRLKLENSVEKMAFVPVVFLLDSDNDNHVVKFNKKLIVNHFCQRTDSKSLLSEN